MRAAGVEAGMARQDAAAVGQRDLPPPPSPSVTAAVACLPTTGPTERAPEATGTPTMEQDTVRDHLRQTQQEVQRRFPGVAFPLAVPHDLPGLTTQPPLITEPPSPPVVGIRLDDPQNPRRWIGVGQSVGGFGAAEIPLAETMPMQGVTARVGCGTTTEGDHVVVTPWEQAGVTSHVTGHQVDATLVVQVARSVAPLATTSP